MSTNEHEKIDAMYSKMLETADIIGREGITNESVDALKSIEDGVNELTLNENTPNTSENVTSNVKIDATSGEFDSKEVMTSYDPITGDQTVVNGSESIAKKIAERHLDNLINGTSTMSDEIIKETLDQIISTNSNSSSVIATLIARRMAGEDFDVYEAMPDDYKRQIDMIQANALNNIRNGNKMANMFNRNTIAKMILDDMIEDFKKSINTQIDLDTILHGFNKDVNKISNDISTELGGMMMSFDEERKAEIDAAIKRCEENGKTEAVKSLKAMRDTIDDAYNLNKFIEFCKTCKIKNIEAKEPEKRAFFHFNSKYEKHRYTINDIRSCPDILDRHLTEYNHTQNTLICIAFCKYCMRMNPDNMNEHTFMYYFIRNIIAIDRLNPKGRLYEGMDDRSKQFYDKFLSRLKLAMEAIISRNPNFSDEAMENQQNYENTSKSSKKSNKKNKSRGNTTPYIYSLEN